jgi:hypothetical protein
VEFAPEVRSRLQRWLIKNSCQTEARATEPARKIPPPPVDEQGEARQLLVRDWSIEPVVTVRPPAAVPVLKRPTERYAPLLVCAMLGVTMALAFAIYNGNRRPQSTRARAVRPVGYAARLQHPAARPQNPPAAVRTQHAANLPQAKAPRSTTRAATPKKNVSSSRRKQVPVDYADGPEVILRRYVNGRWVVVSPGGQ